MRHISSLVLWANLFPACLFANNANAQTLQVVVVANTTDPTIGVERDVYRLHRALSENVPPQRLSVTLLAPKEFRWESGGVTNGAGIFGGSYVLRELRRKRANRDDTFLFIFSGHGGRTTDNRHFMEMPDRSRLLSDEVRQVIDQKHCQLAILLSCSCNVSPLDEIVGPLASREPEPGGPRAVSPIAKALFFDHRGVVHINSAFPGHYAFGGQENGSWFFQAFASRLEWGSANRVSWSEMVSYLDGQLNAKFAKRFPHGHPKNGQKDARVAVYSGARYLQDSSEISTNGYLPKDHAAFAIYNNTAARVEMRYRWKLNTGKWTDWVDHSHINSSGGWYYFKQKDAVKGQVAFDYIGGDNRVTLKQYDLDVKMVDITCDEPTHGKLYRFQFKEDNVLELYTGRR